MSERDAGAAGTSLQFDHVQQATPGSTADRPVASCAVCHRPIESEYYDVNGVTVCSSCRVAVETSAGTPLGTGTMLKAGLFGLGAGIVGAAIYAAVMVLTNLEIGLVAILIGYMVGYSVRKGAGGRGGRRFQILAIALTYVSVAMAYVPAVVSAVTQQEDWKSEIAVPVDGSAGSRSAAETESPGAGIPGGGNVVLAAVVVIGFTLALPVIVIAGSMPSGLISAAIILFGMHQAWKMTGKPVLVVTGPYRVGAVASVPL